MRMFSRILTFYKNWLIFHFNRKFQRDYRKTKKMLFKILVMLSLLSLAQAGCNLCEIPSDITRRPSYMIDTTPRQTCVQLYISLKLYGTESMCTEMIGKYQETCCGAEDPGQDQGPTAAPTCLLYTSPSPRDRTRSRMPSSA